VQYGNADGSWNVNAVHQLADFLLGLDVNNGVTVDNERMLDVVRPVAKRWKPEQNLADVDIYDHAHKSLCRLHLGDWVMRDSNTYHTYIEGWALSEHYEEILPEPVVETDLVEELANLIYMRMPWEGETYQAVADSLATTIVSEGWTKEK